MPKGYSRLGPTVGLSTRAGEFGDRSPENQKKCSAVALESRVCISMYFLLFAWSLYSLPGGGTRSLLGCWRGGVCSVRGGARNPDQQAASVCAAQLHILRESVAATMRRKMQVESWHRSVPNGVPEPYLCALTPRTENGGALPSLRALRPGESNEVIKNELNIQQGLQLVASTVAIVNARTTSHPSMNNNIVAAAANATAAAVASAAANAGINTSNMGMGGMPSMAMAQANQMPSATGMPMPIMSGMTMQQATPLQGQMIVPTVVEQATFAQGYMSQDAMGLMGHSGRTSSAKHCIHPGCTKGAIGKLRLCIAHGGGKRCSVAGCNKAAQGQKPLCKAHGGGRRCKHPGCPRSARDRTDLCIGHGGGKRCIYQGCTTSARSGTIYCSLHDGVIKKHTGVQYAMGGVPPDSSMGGYQ